MVNVLFSTHRGFVWQESPSLDFTTLLWNQEKPQSSIVWLFMPLCIHSSAQKSRWSSCPSAMAWSKEMRLSWNLKGPRSPSRWPSTFLSTAGPVLVNRSSRRKEKSDRPHLTSASGRPSPNFPRRLLYSTYQTQVPINHLYKCSIHATFQLYSRQSAIFAQIGFHELTSISSATTVANVAIFSLRLMTLRIICWVTCSLGLIYCECYWPCLYFCLLSQLPSSQDSLVCIVWCLSDFVFRQLFFSCQPKKLTE